MIGRLLLRAFGMNSDPEYPVGEPETCLCPCCGHTHVTRGVYIGGRAYSRTQWAIEHYLSDPDATVGDFERMIDG